MTKKKIETHSLAEVCDCKANRERTAEKIANLLQANVDPHESGHSDIVIVFVNHTGSSLLGNVGSVQAKIEILREVCREWEEDLNQGDAHGSKKIQ